MSDAAVKVSGESDASVGSAVASDAGAGAAIAARFLLQRGDFKLDVDVAIAMHGTTGIFGVSGAGKTSLLRCIAGLEKASAGRLAVGDETWQDEHTFRAIHERSVGYVFQQPRLFPHLDVQGNLDYGVKRRVNRNNAVCPNRDKMIALLDLQPLLRRRVSTLSGGEAQRVAIARALLCAPKLLLMDEPLASLDRQRRHEVLPYIERLRMALKIPLLYVSHSMDEIARLCDELIVMEEGRVTAAGSLQTMLLRTDIFGGEEASAVIHGRALRYDAQFDLTQVKFSGGEIWVSGRRDAGAALRLRIRAGDVSLCRSRPADSTILNILPAVIERMDSESPASQLLRLQLGDDYMLARITQRSAAELNLQAGERVFAQIKSVAVRDVPVAATSVMEYNA